MLLTKVTAFSASGATRVLKHMLVTVHALIGSTHQRLVGPFHHTLVVIIVPIAMLRISN